MKTGLPVAALLVCFACSKPSASSPETKEKAGDTQGLGTVVRLDPALDALLSKDAQIEKVAGGFTFIEGPLWRPEGALWFSDVQGDVVRQWTPDGKVIEILNPGGRDAFEPKAGAYPGPNGAAADKDGAVLICQHTAHRIIRVDKNKKISTVVDKYQGKRLNSPNDLVFRSDGSLYFTDPPYGLPKQDDDPAKQLNFNGVYRLKDGKLDLLVKDLTRPNGIALSPDEKVLYVANSDPKRKLWMRYDVASDGSVSNGKVFFDVTSETEDGLPDGMKVDQQGNVYATGPGGVWVFTPEGKHIGTIKPPEIPANCGWGDDGKTLYMTARTGLYRIKLRVAGKTALYQ
jgi:gluconolactonase